MTLEGTTTLTRPLCPEILLIPTQTMSALPPPPLLLLLLLLFAQHVTSFSIHDSSLLSHSALISACKTKGKGKPWELYVKE